MSDEITTTEGDGATAAPTRDAVLPAPSCAPDTSAQVGSRRPIVANWARHPVLARLFADWTALWLPPESSALPRWQSVALAAGAQLAKHNPHLENGKGGNGKGVSHWELLSPKIFWSFAV